MGDRSHRPALRRWVFLVVGLLIPLWIATAAAADPDHDAEPVEESPTPPPSPTSPATREPPTPSLELVVPSETALGEAVRLEATLVDRRGRPLVGERITFFADAEWSDELRGEMVLGTGFTDETGTASILTDLRTSAEISIGARFSGNARYRPVDATAAIDVFGDDQLYTPEPGLRLPPGLWWLLLAVAAVWGTYLLVVRQVVGVARAGIPERATGEGDPALGRRRFLGAFVLPAGLMAAVGSLGSGLLTLVARSPRTHGNREPYGWHTGSLRHRVTAVARVGAHVEPRAMPAILDREVSFGGEILPILMEKGGPHSHPSTFSPPPHDVRLDSYAAIMGSEPEAHTEEGDHEEPEHPADDHAPRPTAEDEPSEAGAHGHRLVVPGKPEQSMLVMMLLSPAHQMPPSVPLSDQEIQLIASWVAQGAPDN